MTKWQVGDLAVDSGGRLYQRIGDNDAHRPWRYLTAPDDLASYPHSVARTSEDRPDEDDLKRVWRGRPGD